MIEAKTSTTTLPHRYTATIGTIRCPRAGRGFDNGMSVQNVNYADSAEYLVDVPVRVIARI